MDSHCHLTRHLPRVTASLLSQVLDMLTDEFEQNVRPHKALIKEIVQAEYQRHRARSSSPALAPHVLGKDADGADMVPGRMRSTKNRCARR